MNGSPNMQITPDVNQALANANIPLSPALTQYFQQNVTPYLDQLQYQMYQTQVSLQDTLQFFVNQNRCQLAEIERLKQVRQTMPRMFCERQIDGYGVCIDHGNQTLVGKLRIRSVCHCHIDKDGYRKELLYVLYSNTDDNIHSAVIPRDKLASKNLLPLFESFQWMCKSKAMANDYIAHCINNFAQKRILCISEYPGFSFVKSKEGSTLVQFFCNRNQFRMNLLKHCSPYFTKKVLPRMQDRPLGIKEICEKYLDTDKKMMLFVFSLCGLLSSFFREEKYSMERILTISAPDAASERFATLLMQIFNRGTKPLTLCSNKSAVRTELLHAKDETVILSDRSIIDDDKKRTEMLQHILTENDNMDCQPHNLAIFSTHAQYLLPPEKKICLTLPENFAPAMTTEEEAEMCDDLNYLVNFIISCICKSYTVLPGAFRDEFHEQIDLYTSYFQGKSKEMIAAGALLDTVYFCVIACFLEFDSQPITMLIRSVLSDSQTVSGTSEDAVSEQFIAALNDAIRSGKLKILRHSKEMDFQEGTNQLIVKDKLLILEESAIENVLIPSMRTADNTCRILKCLKACEYLHATKKNRYPLVVYSHHRSLRPALIALKSDRILDSDVELMIEESRYAEWYSTAPAPEHFIPLTENRIGGVSYQVFDEKRKDNMHFFALGKSGSGKTHCLTERMVSLQKLHRPVIVFDTSESFTEEEILEKLSVGCGETAEQDVRAYIAEHITFHRIEEDGIPVDLLKLDDSGNGEDTIRKIESIVESHNPNMGSKQQAAVHAAISDMIQNGNVDMASLYEVLTSEQIPYDLADQLADTLSFFVNFKANDRDWGKLIEESKDIIIISTKAVRSNGGSGLIDMLLMSLYYYQQAHGEKQLSVFIDEIRTQNLSTKGPIAKILTESRKNRMSLNFATQFLPKSTQVREIMDNAAIHAFFPLDDRTAASAAKLLQVDSKELTLLETGECYIKGTFYNQNRQKAIPGILHGTTYRNFKKSKPESSSHSFIDVPCFDEKRCNFPPAKN